MKEIHISINDQSLSLKDKGKVSKTYPISSAKNGIGSEKGSYKTPTGNFVIAEKYGHNAPIYTIFKNRKPAGEWQHEDHCDDDLITSRILWLDGIDSENSNTKERYIYIHGTNHENAIGSPISCGCIRMRNQDIIELFEHVTENTPVRISI